MSPAAPVTFEEFYAHYLALHEHPINRRLHFAGTLLAPAIVVAAAISQAWWMTLFAPVVGYGLAWLGHFLFEGNRPAAFRRPWWSFVADWRMCADILRGRVSLTRVNA